MADKKVGEQFYSPPPKLGKWEGFKVFLWNSETSQFLGRTGGSWAKILFFYVVFYAVLVGFFAAMLAVFYQTLDNKTPKWQLNDGLIGSNPGLGFRPMPPESNVESTLVWYKHTDEKNWRYWTNELDNFLSTYEDKNVFHANSENCTEGHPPKPGKFCRVFLDSFGPCNKTNNYEYDKKRPCIFLKLNKIFNWNPELYNSSTPLPSKMPSDLSKIIKGEEPLGHIDSKDMVWVTCEGENPADNENIGNIYYHPARGFPAQFFPFTNVEGYLPPLVAVQFEPKAGVLINIECKAWAGNIKHDRADRRGSVHFELMID